MIGRQNQPGIYIYYIYIYTWGFKGAKILARFGFLLVSGILARFMENCPRLHEFARSTKSPNIPMSLHTLMCAHDAPQRDQHFEPDPQLQLLMPSNFISWLRYSPNIFWVALRAQLRACVPLDLATLQVRPTKSSSCQQL